jgi:peptide-methionine (S)-S-oxide reductase
MDTRRNTLLALGSAATLLAGWAWLGGNASAAEQATLVPPPAFDPPNAAAKETAVFAGGAVSGYAGGDPKLANYQSVSTGRSGHAEAVQVTFDPRQVSYGRLLQIFFSVAHDPTQLDRQGPDSGPQYRSALFYQSPAQQQVAQRYIAQLDAAHVFRAKIVTQLAPLAGFFVAEGYHQDYATRNPDAPYIAHFDAPKIANLQRLFGPQYRQAPVLVASQPAG